METALERPHRPLVPDADRARVGHRAGDHRAARAAVAVVVVADLPQDVPVARASARDRHVRGRVLAGRQPRDAVPARPGRRASAAGSSTSSPPGFREFSKHRKQGSPSDVTLDAARRAMRAAYQREIDAIEAHLAGLATVGSVTPYIGLFGTVWGIMNAFRGLANVSQATLANVAPGIAEALIATAIGLFAAIPAVVAYNRFTHDIDRLAVRFETFIEEFSNILQRQAPMTNARRDLRRTTPIDAPHPQADQPDQRRAVHRRDAGAARHLHGDGAARRTRRDRAAVGRQQADAGDQRASRARESRQVDRADRRIGQRPARR